MIAPYIERLLSRLTCLVCRGFMDWMPVTRYWMFAGESVRFKDSVVARGWSAFGAILCPPFVAINLSLIFFLFFCRKKRELVLDLPQTFFRFRMLFAFCHRLRVRLFSELQNESSCQNFQPSCCIFLPLHKDNLLFFPLSTYRFQIWFVTALVSGRLLRLRCLCLLALLQLVFQ